MGKSIEQLRKEVEGLRKVNEQRQRLLKTRNLQEIEKKRLERELKDLKNPKSKAFKKNLVKGLKKTGKSTYSWLDSIVKASSKM